MTIHFSCTMCGKCCHNLRLPLGVEEALNWLKRGGDVQLFCDAIPWPVEPPAGDALAQHKRRRSFASRSGKLPVRVAVTLVASFDGACPHLQADMRCGAYEARPRVCRIYPAEVNPFVELAPANKACPPDAWTPDKPVFLQAGQPADEATVTFIRQSREADARDADAKMHLCSLLGCSTAALANEGFSIYSPQRDTALAALETVSAASFMPPARDVSWQLVSNRRATIDTLVSIEAFAGFSGDAAAGTFEYLGFFGTDVL
ncbi:MAG TPA: YkgJ family cysteine cluster protein [Paraburkholderia sp.]|jgi:Fe-S-cluster containining protein